MMYHDKFYAVKNDKGEFAHIEMDELTWETGFATVWLSLNKPYAERTSSDYGGHVVELTKKPAPIVVSETEAEMLKRAKSEHFWATNVIQNYIDMHMDGMSNDEKQQFEDRLMRAYVIGWEVEKPKRYVLPMEGTELPDGTVAYAVLDHTGAWTVKGYAEEQSAITFGSTVTQANIDSAPAWVKAITPVEVTEDDD
jgi:hypothetical protein